MSNKTTTHDASGTMSGSNDRIGAYAASFGIALGLTSLINALLVVVKETNEETVLAWMNAATGHHWVTQGMLDIALFLILGFGLVKITEQWRVRPDGVTGALVGGVVLGGLIIAGFFYF